MGNHQSKTQGELTYLINSRKDPIHVKIKDDFPYPRKPKSKDIEQQFSEILKTCILTEEQNQYIEVLNDDDKWKLICKHRYCLLTSKKNNPEALKLKSRAQLFLEGIKVSGSIKDIEKFYDWITQEAQESDINDLLVYEGMTILLSILMRAETCSRATQNYNKQLIILQIISYLTTFQQVVNSLIQLPQFINKIFLNFNKTQLALNKFVLQIATNVSWNSKDGPKLVLDAISFYKTEFGYKLRFEPFIKILEETKNVDLLEIIIMFINTLIESPSQEDKREALRSEFTTCDLKKIYKEIKEKIKLSKYKAEDSVYNQRKELYDKNAQAQGDPSSLLLLDEKEQFVEKLDSILKQIEIFEKGFQEFIKEKEDISKDSHDLVEEKEFDKNDKKKMDFSDINEVFARVVSKTLSNENYENFLKILQQLCLIPSNEQGKNIWTTLNSSLQNINGTKQDKVLKLDRLEELIGHSESKEGLEQKLILLDSQLRVRDDDIKNLKRGKLNMEIKLKVSQKDYENFEKELNKQLNAYKILENQLFELKKTKNTLDSKSLASSPNKKLKEVRTLNESNKVNSKVSEKGNFLNEDKKLDMGDKKNGNISFYSAELEYNKKITESVNLSEIDNNNSIKKFEGIVDGLKKKIAEFEKFINSGIDEGFTSKQYTKLQSNLEKIGFSPLKKKFKVDKGEKNDSENKIQTVKNNDAVNFETKSEGLNYEKNSACIHNFDISNTQKKVPSEILIGSPIKNNKTLKLVLTNSPAIEEKSEIAGELNQSKNKETELSLTKNLESSNEDRTLAKSFDIEFKNEEVKSNESKQEEKNKDIQTLFVPPTILQHSESESPSNSPLNLPPLPPPLFGSKPGLPPMLNLLNLLNKKPDGPIKEKKKPNVPMKSLLWTLVNPSNIKGTIWETIDESTVSYEIPNLENEFTSLRADKTQTISKVPAKISLIAPNRAQNLNIMLTRLKMSPSMIAEAILLINVELLNLNVVNCLLETIPNADEFSLISNYGGDLNLLESPEKYIIEVKDIKNLKVRLQAMQFYFTHKELFEDLQLKISKLIELFENISKEQRIIILMKYTLAIGNYMNGESARGGAFGFKLDAFEKIIDIKNSNGKKNLLAYIINIIEKNSGNSFIEVTDEFFLYEFGKKLPISQLFCDLELIRKGIENVKTARQNKNLGVIDNIEEILGNFETEMRNQYRNVEIDLKSLDQKYKRVCEFYCEDPKQMSSDIFVESFNKIWICCKKAKTILIKENKDNMKEIKEQKVPIRRKSNVGNIVNSPEELANTITNLRINGRPSIVG